MPLIEGGPIDFLSFMHIINNMIIGIFLKNKYLLVFFIGILWEIIEYMIVNTQYFKKLILQYYPIKIEKWEDITNKSFDLIFNMIGYYIGNQINIKYDSKYECKSYVIYTILKYITLFHIIIYFIVK